MAHSLVLCDFMSYEMGNCISVKKERRGIRAYLVKSERVNKLKEQYLLFPKGRIELKTGKMYQFENV